MYNRPLALPTKLYKKITKMKCIILYKFTEIRFVLKLRGRFSVLRNGVFLLNSYLVPPFDGELCVQSRTLGLSSSTLIKTQVDTGHGRWSQGRGSFA